MTDFIVRTQRQFRSCNKFLISATDKIEAQAKLIELNRTLFITMVSLTPVTIDNLSEASFLTRINDDIFNTETI